MAKRNMKLVRLIHQDAQRCARAFRHMKLDPQTRRTYRKHFFQGFILQAAKKTVGIMNRIHPNRRPVTYRESTNFELAIRSEESLEQDKAPELILERVNTNIDTDFISLSAAAAESKEIELIRKIVQQLKLEVVLGISQDDLNALLYLEPEDVIDDCANPQAGTKNPRFGHYGRNNCFIQLAKDQAAHSGLKQLYEENQKDIDELEEKVKKIQETLREQRVQHEPLAGRLRGKIAVATADRSNVSMRARILQCEVEQLARQYRNDFEYVDDPDDVFGPGPQIKVQNPGPIDAPEPDPSTQSDREALAWENISELNSKIARLHARRDAIEKGRDKHTMQLERLWAKDVFLKQDLMGAQDTVAKMIREQDALGERLMELEQRLIETLTEIEWKAQQAREIKNKKDKEEPTGNHEGEDDDGDVIEPWDFDVEDRMDVDSGYAILADDEEGGVKV